MVVHVVPLQSFMTRTSIDIGLYGTGRTSLDPWGQEDGTIELIWMGL